MSRKVETLGMEDVVALGRTFRSRVERLAGMRTFLLKTPRGSVKFIVTSEKVVSCDGSSNIVMFQLTSAPHPNRRIRDTVDPPHTLNACVLSAVQPPRTVRLDMVTAKPSHGIASGSHAMALLMDVARAIGFKHAVISDASSLSQCEYFEPQVSFKALLMLSRGVSWYDGTYGFTPSVVGERSAGTLRVYDTTISDMRAYFVAASTAIRESIDGPGRGKGKKQGASTKNSPEVQWYAVRGRGCSLADMEVLKRVPPIAVYSALKAMDDFIDISSRFVHSPSMTLGDILRKESVAGMTCSELSMLLEAIFPNWYPGARDVILPRKPDPPKWIRASMNAAVSVFKNKRLFMSVAL